MKYNYCVFCGCEIPDHLLACDTCRSQVEKLDSDKQKTFECAEKRIKELTEAITAVGEACEQVTYAMIQVLKPICNFISEAIKAAPPRVRHLALYGKKPRTRKKNINRALREYQRKIQKK